MCLPALWSRSITQLRLPLVRSPSKGLERLRTLDTNARLAGHYGLDAVRAHLLEMVGAYEIAIKHYRIAASRTTSIPEQNYLMTQAAYLAERKLS
jgi:predicted RNA polymerase sigma factor